MESEEANGWEKRREFDSPREAVADERVAVDEGWLQIGKVVRRSLKYQ